MNYERLEETTNTGKEMLNNTKWHVDLILHSQELIN